MDMSKLPRLSQTTEAPPTGAADPPPPPPPPLPGAPASPTSPAMDYRAARDDRGTGADVWVSAIIGLVFLMLGWNFAKYLGAALTGRTYQTNVTWTAGPKAGQAVAYPDLEGNPMLTDSAMFLFGLALVLEAVVLAVANGNARFKRPLVGVALAIAVAATAYNLYVAARLFSGGLLPLQSLLAVAFGGYIAANQRRMFQDLGSGRGSASAGALGR